MDLYVRTSRNAAKTSEGRVWTILFSPPAPKCFLAELRIYNNNNNNNDKNSINDDSNNNNDNNNNDNKQEDFQLPCLLP